jgi:hypothetical protein
MWNLRIVTCVFGGALILISAADAQKISDDLKPSFPLHQLSNQSIVTLAEAGYDQEFIVDLIRHKQGHFDTSVEGLTFLAQHGISQSLVRFVVASENAPTDQPVTGSPTVPLSAATLADTPNVGTRPMPTMLLAANAKAATTRNFVDDPDLPRIFISPMAGELDGFIAAEIIRQRLPVQVVVEEKDAQLVLAGMSLRKVAGKSLLSVKETGQDIGNVRLMDVRTGTMIWAGEAGDWAFSVTRSNGLRKVAGDIVTRMKKESFAGKSVGITSALGSRP